jgi:methyltransferase family protein
MVQGERRNAVVGEPLGGGIRGEPLIAVIGDAGGRADPQRAVGARRQRRDGVAGQVPFVLVEDHELIAVEARQSFVGSEPKVTVGGLGNGANGVLGEPLLLTPGRPGVLGETLARIESVDGRETGCKDTKIGQQKPRRVPSELKPDDTLIIELRVRMHEILKNLPPDSLVLDLGSGQGSFAPEATAATAVRLDRQAPKNAGTALFVQGDAPRMPFPDGTFAAVVANHCLEHFDDLVKLW